MLSAPVDTMPPLCRARDEIGAMARSMSMFRSALAQRLARACGDLGGLIANATESVGCGVGLIQAAGAALHDVTERAAGIDGLIASIAAAAQEPSASLFDANRAVNLKDQNTQRTALMVDQTNTAGRISAHEAEQLAGLVGKFRDRYRTTPKGSAHKAA